MLYKYRSKTQRYGRPYNEALGVVATRGTKTLRIEHRIIIVRTTYAASVGLINRTRLCYGPSLCLLEKSYKTVHGRSFTVHRKEVHGSMGNSYNRGHTSWGRVPSYVNNIHLDVIPCRSKPFNGKDTLAQRRQRVGIESSRCHWLLPRPSFTSTDPFKITR